MDRHLNIFDFFNNKQLEYYEDNLSRAFAICLKYDTVFLNSILREVLNIKQYNLLFNTDFPDYRIEIDLQVKPNELEGITEIIAVACSGIKIDFDKISQLSQKTTSEPITDLCIKINDICLIFEFKRTNEDCSAQLKNQVDKIEENNTDALVNYMDLNWSKIIKIGLNTLSIQRQINTENPFLIDFITFLENKHPKWFPLRLLYNTPFPHSDNDPNNYHLNNRLNQIKRELFGEENTTMIKGKYNRVVISKDLGWAKEIHIKYRTRDKKNYLTVEIYPGDTKRQGQAFFINRDEALKWPDTVLKNYFLSSEPYIKFSHFNSRLFWLLPNQKEYNKTHTKSFFNLFAGRYKKEKWDEFENSLESYIPNWKDKCDYKHEIINSNRTYFDLSIGTLIIVYIPYESAQKLDYENNDQLIILIKNIIEELISIVNL